jgi:mono/diheme cytochrome c family protein
MTPRRYATAFAAGLVLVVALGFMRQQLWPAEWQRHQRVYNSLRRAAGLAPVEEGIRALQVAGREERCVSCHLGAVLPAFDQAPLQAHPDTACALPIEQQGCTGCHGGEPLRVTMAGAHGTGGDTRRALTDGAERAERLRRIQSGCAGCHQDRSGGVLRYDADKVPEVAEGMQQFLSQGCAACHRVAGVFSAAEHGPALTEVALRWSRQPLLALLRAPRSVHAASPMPPLTSGEADAERLLTFLLAQVGPQREPGCGAACALQAARARPGMTDHVQQPLPRPANPAAGAWWARQLGCTGCHRASSTEAGVPELTRVGWYRSEEQLRALVHDPRKVMPGTWMPRMQVPEPIVESLVAWLLLQKAPLPSSPDGVLREVCRRCHGRERDAKTVLLSRLPPLLDGNKGGMTKDRFIEKASAGVEGTAMPPWGRMLAGPFLGAIHDALE